MNTKIDTGIVINDRVYEGNRFAELAEMKKVMEILVNAINPESLNDEERQTFNKFKENRLKVKEIKNNYG
jgi:hypothetical protein